MIQTRQCCHARDQSHRIAENRVLFPKLWSREKTDTSSILLIRSASARSGESSLLPSIGDLSLEPSSERNSHLFRTILLARDNCSTRARSGIRCCLLWTSLSTDTIHQCCVAWMVKTWRFNGFVAESEESTHLIIVDLVLDGRLLSLHGLFDALGRLADLGLFHHHCACLDTTRSMVRR